MKCLFCTSEALPFAASGGLGDVAGSLPQALRQRLIGCRIVMPLYEDIPQKLREEMRFITSLSVPVSWRRQYCGVFEARYGGVIYYLLDNQYYFKRKGLYGHYDDAERFAFLSRAALEMLPYIDFKPDIIHCNDWQTALVPIYYSLFYANNDWYSGIKTIFTIHNIQYQGKYGLELMEDVLGIPEQAQSIVEFDHCVNLMKGAIETADCVTTVSPTYAKEILDPWFSYGMDRELVRRQDGIRGILNGIDVDLYNPETDPDIKEHYQVNRRTGKKACKTDLLEEMKWEDNGQPVIGIVTRFVAHKGIHLIQYAFQEMLELGCRFVILGSGEKIFEDFFREMQLQHPEQVSVHIGFLPQMAKRIYAGADIFLMPSQNEPCGLAQMVAMRYGTIPIVRETGGLKDTVTDAGTIGGNGFTFKTYDAMDMLDAVKRACALYQEKRKWNALVKRAMLCDFSWNRSAKDYLDLYQEITGQN